MAEAYLGMTGRTKDETAKKVKIKKINNFWMDFGRPEDIEKLCKYLENENCKNTKKSDK